MESTEREPRVGWLHIRLTERELAALQAEAERKSLKVSALASAALTPLFLGAQAGTTEARR